MNRIVSALSLTIGGICLSYPLSIVQAQSAPGGSASSLQGIQNPTASQTFFKTNAAGLQVPKAVGNESDTSPESVRLIKFPYNLNLVTQPQRAEPYSNIVTQDNIRTSSEVKVLYQFDQPH
jgi:hypothetical protein